MSDFPEDKIVIINGKEYIFWHYEDEYDFEYYVAAPAKDFFEFKEKYPDKYENINCPRLMLYDREDLEELVDDDY